MTMETLKKAVSIDFGYDIYFEYQLGNLRRKTYFS